VLDEIDSGLDVDALRAVSRRIEAETAETGLGVLAITHYNRLLHELHSDRVHVLSQGRIVVTGGPELALELESTGYGAYAPQDEADMTDAGRPVRPVQGPDTDPFADPLA
jgi:Fe-S cluster assembly ATP-binding protein